MNFGQRPLAKQVGISFTYLSKIENDQLDFGEYLSDNLIRRLATPIEADEDELLLLAANMVLAAIDLP